MKTMYDFKRKIMYYVRVEKTISFKDLYSKVEIKNYQERSNFLEALYNLQITKQIFNSKKYTYQEFPSDTHDIERVIKKDNSLILANRKLDITEEINNGTTILENDLVIIDITNEEELVITKVLKRDIASFIPYLLKELEQKELTYQQIKRLAVAKNKEAIVALKTALTELERTGKIIKINNSYKKWPKDLTLTKLELDKRGRAFYKVGEKKIYPIGAELKGAMQQDILAVTRKGKHIEKIISRDMPYLVAEVIERDGVRELTPVLLPSKEKVKVRISSSSMRNLAPGDRILVNVSLTKTDDVYEADFVNKLGRVDDPNIDIISIAAKYGYVLDFEKEVMDEAYNTAQYVSKKELVNRYDFSDSLLTFTIDCDSTKDMDDAVSLFKDENNHYILGVHIADVAHYVKENSLLDRTARNRAFSVYPANSVIPALPHSLSNGICSLNPNVKRLTKSIIMELDENGELISYKLVNSAITSRKKMAYSKVNKILNDEEIPEDYLPFVDNLKLMAELSDKLTAIRTKEGMLDFNEEEVAIIEDETGAVIDFEEKDNGKAGRIIENYMILANYCAALYLNFTVGHSINRVHTAPEANKLDQAKEKLASIGINFPKDKDIEPAKFLQIVLDEYKDKSEYKIVSEILLKSLPRANYSPFPLGHFGLGLDYYSHFTSPIRRYPDLKIHQMIDNYLAHGGVCVESEEKLIEICEHCSFKEIQADLLENEVTKVKMMDYVDRHREKIYHGTITGIDSERAYLETTTHIPGYFEYEQDDDIRFIRTRNYIKNKDDQVILKIGDEVEVEGLGADRMELQAKFGFIKNLTLTQENKKGAAALKGQYVKKM